LEVSVPAADGLLLKGMLVYPELPIGGPFPLAVLAHQYPTTADSFSPLIDDLLDLDIAVLAFDLRGHGASTTGSSGPVVIDTPVGFTVADFGAAFMSSVARVGFGRIDDDILRMASWGAVQNFIDSSRILLVGASIGGSGALLAARQVPALSGVITLGAAGALAFADGPARIRQSISACAAPMFLASSEEDPFEGAQNVRDWSEGQGHVTPKLVPGAAHGMAIYYAVRETMEKFIKRALRL